MEHKIITGGEQFLPFARSRIKALRATGLKYAGQQFEIDGCSIKVRIAGEHEYITLDGGVGLYIFLTKEANTSTGMGTDNYYGSIKTKTWVYGLGSGSRNLSRARLLYVGETDLDFAETKSISLPASGTYAGDPDHWSGSILKNHTPVAVDGAPGGGCYYANRSKIASVGAPVTEIHKNLYQTYTIPTDTIVASGNDDSGSLTTFSFGAGRVDSGYGVKGSQVYGTASESVYVTPSIMIRYGTWSGSQTLDKVPSDILHVLGTLYFSLTTASVKTYWKSPIGEKAITPEAGAPTVLPDASLVARTELKANEYTFLEAAGRPQNRKIIALGDYIYSRCMNTLLGPMPADAVALGERQYLVRPTGATNRSLFELRGVTSDGDAIPAGKIVDLKSLPKITDDTEMDALLSSPSGGYGSITINFQLEQSSDFYLTP